MPEDQKKSLVFKITIDDSIRLDFDGQHTLRWDKLPLNGSAKQLAYQGCVPAGACNLYFYPEITFDKEVPPQADKDIPRKASLKMRLSKHTKLAAVKVTKLAAVEVLEEIIYLLATRDGQFRDVIDQSGATPLLALLVANTEDAVGLYTRIYRDQPKVLLQVHALGRFEGERALHVLIANQQTGAVLELIKSINDSDFTKKEVKDLFFGQVTGEFFKDPPMMYYGSRFSHRSSPARIGVILRARNDLSYSHHPYVAIGLYYFHIPVNTMTLLRKYDVHALCASSMPFN